MPNDNFGRTVTFSTDGATDTYIVGAGLTLIFPAGTSQSVVYAEINSMAPTLSQFPLAAAKAQQIALLQQNANDFISSRYTDTMRLNLNFIYNVALSQGLTNRAAYLLQLETWGLAILSYTAGVAGTISAQTTSAGVAAIAWNFGAVAVDPQVTVFGALAITN